MNRAGEVVGTEAAAVEQWKDSLEESRAGRGDVGVSATGLAILCTPDLPGGIGRRLEPSTWPHPTGSHPPSHTRRVTPAEPHLIESHLTESHLANSHPADAHLSNAHPVALPGRATRRPEVDPSIPFLYAVRSS
jgi:hypothetical protein